MNTEQNPSLDEIIAFYTSQNHTKSNESDENRCKERTKYGLNKDTEQR